ncbi:MAG: M14 family zinc carboxypeptidase [Bdellovibrionales bacterium]
MIHLPSWASTDLGTPIELYASASLQDLGSRSPILLMGGVHGDEPLGVHLAQKTLEFLSQAENLAAHPWILIPILNVDGYRRGTRVNGRGVDLNRNYPAQSWSPECEKERYYPGPSAGSEPEIKAVVTLIQQVRPRLLIHCHSWKPMVVCAGEPGMPFAQYLGRSSGYSVVPEIGYPTPGSLSQYGWHDLRIPVICIEEDDHCPPKEVWPHFAEGMRDIFLDATAASISAKV